MRHTPSSLGLISAVITTAFWFAGCTHTVTVTTHELISTFTVPEVAPVAQMDTLNAKAALEFKSTHQAAGQCVFRDAISAMFWKDDQKLDRLLLAEPSASGYQLYRVEIVGEKRIQHVSGTRNGKKFESTRILN